MLHNLQSDICRTSKKLYLKYYIAKISDKLMAIYGDNND